MFRIIYYYKDGTSSTPSKPYPTLRIAIFQAELRVNRTTLKEVDYVQVIKMGERGQPANRTLVYDSRNYKS